VQTGLLNQLSQNASSAQDAKKAHCNDTQYPMNRKGDNHVSNCDHHGENIEQKQAPLT